MTTNRLLTTAVQLALMGVTIPLVISVIKDIKENGLQTACRLDKGGSCPQSFVGGYPQVYAQMWKTPEKSGDNLRRVDLTDKTDIFM